MTEERRAKTRSGPQAYSNAMLSPQRGCLPSGCRNPLALGLSTRAAVGYQFAAAAPAASARQRRARQSALQRSSDDGPHCT
eukprot:710127-Pleurochrysis_carterae.AAC.2